MLHEAGIKPPYILVGHSFGGLVMRKFALLYPEEVSSIILVDPMRCEEWPPLDPTKQARLTAAQNSRDMRYPLLGWDWLGSLSHRSCADRDGSPSDLAGAAGEGGKHVLGRVRGEVSKMPQEVWPIVAAHWSRPGYYAGMRSHVNAVPETVREMQNAKPIHGIPVLVLTPGKSSPLSEDCLRRIGDNVQQVIASASAHWIHLDEPQLVIDSIQQMVTAASSQKLVALG